MVLIQPQANPLQTKIIKLGINMQFSGVSWTEANLTFIVDYFWLTLYWYILCIYRGTVCTVDSNYKPHGHGNVGRGHSVQLCCLIMCFEQWRTWRFFTLQNAKIGKDFWHGYFSNTKLWWKPCYYVHDCIWRRDQGSGSLRRMHWAMHHLTSALARWI